VSDAVEQMAGLTPQEVYADPSVMFRVVDPADLETIRTRSEKSRRTLTTTGLELRITATNGGLY